MITRHILIYERVPLSASPSNKVVLDKRLLLYSLTVSLLVFLHPQSLFSSFLWHFRIKFVNLERQKEG